MSEMRLIDFNLPDPMGPPPANLQLVTAGRQNTLTVNPGAPVRVTPPDAGGGPRIWIWHIMNIGAGVLWARWDGLGYAAVNDAHSLQIPATAGFSDIAAGVMTFDATAATTVTFTLDNSGRR